LTLLALLSAPAGAAPIGADSFGPNSSFESFERLAVIGGSNIARPIQNQLIPGSEGPYTFSSGATLDWGPGTGGVNDGVNLFDFSLVANPAHGVAGSGFWKTGVIPDGEALLSRGGQGSITFTFDQDMRRVGASVTGEPGISGAPVVITMTAFDAEGALLGSHSAPAVPFTAWRDHFFGLEAEGIRRVTFTGENLALDALRFETVPEPATWAAWGLVGLGALAARSRRGRNARDRSATSRL
jgi:MYXO-CTERM domain-containing protein